MGRSNPKEGLHRARLRLAFPIFIADTKTLKHSNTVSKCQWEMMTLCRPFFGFELCILAGRLEWLQKFDADRSGCPTGCWE